MVYTHNIHGAAGAGAGNANTDDLAVSLEEFGLSKYEARAYLTMIGKGSLAASEIAYYSNLPRTKVYQTLKKLEKKRLAVLSRKKPLICSAIPPEEGFAEILNLHERRIKNMKKIVDRLQKINDRGQRPKGSEERRYFILDPNSTLEKVAELILHSKTSINAVLDTWGTRLLSQCRLSILKAVTNGVHIRIVDGAQSMENDSLSLLPDGIELRIGDALGNSIIIDSTYVVSVDSSNGKALLVNSMDMFSASHSRTFDDIWNKAIEVKGLSSTGAETANKAIRLIKIIENGLAADMLEYSINNHGDFPAELLDTIEAKSGLNIMSMNASEMLAVVDSALKMGYSGILKHDRNNNTISLQSKVDSKHLLPWAFMLASYFKNLGNNPKLMQNPRQSQNSQLIHVRLSKPI